MNTACSTDKDGIVQRAHSVDDSANLVGDYSSRSVVRWEHQADNEVLVCVLYCVRELQGVGLTPLVKDRNRNGIDVIFTLASIH